MVRILVVEDDPGLAEVLSDLLSARGRKVHRVVDAETAFRSFRRERLNLVMIDAVLPGMSGLELLRIIRGESQVPVIMMSGKDCADMRRQALRLGACAFLRKPFTPLQVESCVRRALALGSISV